MPWALALRLMEPAQCAGRTVGLQEDHGRAGRAADLAQELHLAASVAQVLRQRLSELVGAHLGAPPPAAWRPARAPCMTGVPKQRT